MSGGGGRKRVEVVATLQGRDEFAAAMLRGDIEQPLCDPHEIGLGQSELSQRIPDMRVETVIDQEKVGAKNMQSGQEQSELCHAKLAAAIAGIERSIEDFAGSSLAQTAGAREER